MKPTLFLLLLFAFGKHSYAQDTIPMRYYGNVLDGAYVKAMDPDRKEGLIDPFAFEKFKENEVTIEAQKKLPKQLKPVKEEMAFFPGGTFWLGNENMYTPTDSDTSLLFFNQYKKADVSPFLMGRQEITNKEYREFVSAVLDSSMRDALHHAGIQGYSHKIVPDPSSGFPMKDYILDYTKPIDMKNEQIFKIIDAEFYKRSTDRFYDRPELDMHKLKYRYATGKGLEEDNIEYLVAIYPDTSCWTVDFPFYFFEPLTENYFWHPSFDDYPVVGINIYKANAYCDWRNQQLQKELTKHPELQNAIGKYRLPTNEEWECAASHLNTLGWRYNRMISRYNEEFVLERDGANLGAIQDVNGYRQPVDRFDIYETTCKVNEMKSEAGVYHLRGNVAEWTSSILEEPFTPDTTDVSNNFNCWFLNNTYIEILLSDNVESIKQKLKEINKPITSKYDEEEYEILLTRAAVVLLHDYNVRTREEVEMQIVRGGSWADSPIYSELMEVYPAYTTSAQIGFRLVLEITPDAIPYFISDEYFHDLKQAEKK